MKPELAYLMTALTEAETRKRVEDIEAIGICETINEPVDFIFHNIDEKSKSGEAPKYLILNFLHKEGTEIHTSRCLMGKNATYLSPYSDINEDLNHYMQRLWDSHEKTGEKIIGIYDELQISTEGAKCVNDMHANALEDAETRLKTGPNKEFWKAVEIQKAKVLGHNFYLNHIMKVMD